MDDEVDERRREYHGLPVAECVDCWLTTARQEAYWQYRANMLAAARRRRERP